MFILYIIFDFKMIPKFLFCILSLILNIKIIDSSHVSPSDKIKTKLLWIN